MEEASTRLHSSSLSLITPPEIISGIDDIRQGVAVAVVPPSSPAKEERNASSDSVPGSRLASLTELLLMNQKAAPKGNSASFDSSPSTRRFSPTRSDDEDATEMRRRAGPSPGGGGGGAHQRPVAAAVDLFPSGVVVETDLRRLVFRRSRAKRLVSGLRVHAFTRQAFISSFTVGLALGSVIAIVLKILRDLIHRILYG